MSGSNPSSSGGLVRGLSFTGAVALAVGSTIGTGVYFKAATMSQLVGSPLLVLAAWVVAGVLSLCGALSFAELGSMMPRSGGGYAWLRESYGPASGFLQGWMQFVVAAAGISALGVGFVSFLAVIVPMPGVWLESGYHLFGVEMHWQLGPREAVAVAAILLLGALNCLGIVFGGRLQLVMTIAKCLGIGLVVVGAFFLSGTGSLSNFRTPEAAPLWPGVQAFGAAMLAALWAFDGWGFMPMVADEVREPERNVPRALILGSLIVLVLYGLANLAYFYALPFSEIASANSTRFRDALPVASKTAAAFLGGNGPAIVSVVFMISAAGALNGLLLTVGRVPFAMARDGLLPAALGRVHPATRVPVLSIALIAVWSAVLALSGTFDQLTDLTIFSEWIFYGLTAGAIFVLRRKTPGARRPYRTLGYPATPIAFMAGAAFLVGNTILTRPVESAVGLGLIATGLPVYAIYRRRLRA